MLYYMLGRALVYLFFGGVAVYLVEKMKQKPLSFEMRFLITLTGGFGFFVALITYLLYKAFK